MNTRIRPRTFGLLSAHNRMTHEPRFDKNRSDATKADAGNPDGVVEEA